MHRIHQRTVVIILAIIVVLAVVFSSIAAYGLDIYTYSGPYENYIILNVPNSQPNEAGLAVQWNWFNFLS